MRLGDNVGSVYVKVIADATGVADDIEDQLDGGLNRWQREVAIAGEEGGKEFGENFGRGYNEGFEKKASLKKTLREITDDIDDELGKISQTDYGKQLEKDLKKGIKRGIDVGPIKNRIATNLQEALGKTDIEGRLESLGYTPEQLGSLTFDLIEQRLKAYEASLKKVAKEEERARLRRNAKARQRRKDAKKEAEKAAKAELKALIDGFLLREKLEKNVRLAEIAAYKEKAQREKQQRKEEKARALADAKDIIRKLPIPEKVGLRLLDQAKKAGKPSGEAFADEFIKNIDEVAANRPLVREDWIAGSESIAAVQRIADEYDISFGEAQKAVERRNRDLFGKRFPQQVKKSFEGVNLPKTITSKLEEAFGEGGEKAANEFNERFNEIVGKRRFKASDLVNNSELDKALKRLARDFGLYIGDVEKLAKQRNQRIFGAFEPKKNPWEKLKEFNRGFLRNMDRTVRAVLLTVIGFGQEAAFLIQGLGAALGGLASSAAFGLGGLLALAPVLTAAGGAFAVLIAGALNAKKVIPGPLKELKNGFEELGLSVSKRLFAGFSETSGVITGTIIPQLTKGLGSLADVISGGLGDFADLFARFDLGDLFTNLAPTLSTLQEGFLYLTEGVLNFIRLAIPAGERLAETFKDLALQFLSFTQAPSGQNQITTFLDKGVTSLRRWGRLLGSTSSLLSGFFQSGRKEGDSLIVNLTKLVDKWDNWVRSVEGQESLKEFFDTAKPALKAVGTVLGGIKDGFSNLLGDNAEQKLEAFGEGLADIISSLGEMIRILGDTGIFEAVVKVIASLASALEDGSPILETFAGAIKVLADLFAALPGVINGPIAAFGALFLLFKRFGGGPVLRRVTNRITDIGGAMLYAGRESAIARREFQKQNNFLDKNGKKIGRFNRGLTAMGAGLAGVAGFGGPVGAIVSAIGAFALVGYARIRSYNEELSKSITIVGDLGQSLDNVYKVKIRDAATGATKTLGKALREYDQATARSFLTRFNEAASVSVAETVAEEGSKLSKIWNVILGKGGSRISFWNNLFDNDTARPINRFLDELEEEAGNNPVQVRVAALELVDDERFDDKQRKRLQDIINETSGAAGATRVYTSEIGANRRALETQASALASVENNLFAVADANRDVLESQANAAEAREALQSTIEDALGASGVSVQQLFADAGKDQFIDVGNAWGREIQAGFLQAAVSSRVEATDLFATGKIGVKELTRRLKESRDLIAEQARELGASERSIKNLLDSTGLTPKKVGILFLTEGLEDETLKTKQFQNLLELLPQKKVINILSETEGLDLDYLNKLLEGLDKTERVEFLVDLLPQLPEGELRTAVQNEIDSAKANNAQLEFEVAVKPLLEGSLPGSYNVLEGLFPSVPAEPPSWLSSEQVPWANVPPAQVDFEAGNLQPVLDAIDSVTSEAKAATNQGEPWNVKTKTNANKTKTALDNAAAAADTLDGKTPKVTVTVEYVTIGTPPAQVTPPSFIPVPGQRNMPEGLRSGLFPMRNAAIAPLGYSTTGIRRASTTPTNGGGKTVNNYITVNSNASDPKLVADSIVNRSVILERR